MWQGGWGGIPNANLICYYIYFFIFAVVAQGNKRATFNATVVGSYPTQENEILNIFIFSLWYRSMQCAVEFRYSTRNASRIQRQVGNRSLFMSYCLYGFSVCLHTMLCEGDSVELKYIYFFKCCLGLAHPSWAKRR